MLKQIEQNKATGKSIWKASDNRTGVVSFYGVRVTGDTDKPFVATFPTLWEARESLETPAA